MLKNTPDHIKNLKALLKTSVFSNFVNLGSIQVSNVIVMMLLYPIISIKVGLEAFGESNVANATALLIGVLINFGTSQSSIKDIAANKENKTELSRIFYSALLLRLILFLVFIAGFIILNASGLHISRYFIYTIPLIFAEALNPLFIYLGKESLSVYNISNLLVKVIAIILIVVTIQGPGEAVWINFILGCVHLAAYLFLLIRIIIISKISFKLSERQDFKNMIKGNFYLVGNNLSVQLQQSLIVLVLAKLGNPAWLGAYSICDKITGSGRMLIISICNSVYPRAANLYNTNTVLFDAFKKKIRMVLLIIFSLFAIALIIFAYPIVYLIAGHPDPVSILLLRIMALLQVLAAVNSFNVIELMIKGNNLYIFRIAMLLLIVSAAFSFGIVLSENLFLLGIYPLTVELAALLMYEYVIRKNQPFSLV